MLSRNIISGFFALLLLLVVAACQSTSTTSSADMAAPQRKAVVVTGNGGSTTVFLPTADGKDAYALTGDNGHVCPDCKAAALKYFQGGELEAKCPTCGATRTAVTFVPPTLGHN